jgi:DNA polymerase-1
VLKIPIYERDARLNKVVTDMEARGLRVNIPYLETMQPILEQQAEALKRDISDIAGAEYKAGPKWMRAYLDSKRLRYKIKPETGNPIFGAEGLANIDDPIVKKVLKYHDIIHTISHFFYGISNVLVDGRVYPFIRPYGAATGRMSYNNPNIHSMRGSEDGEDVTVRDLIIPSEGKIFCSLDFDQQEMRLLFDYAGEQGMIDKINDTGIDVHTLTATDLKIDRSTAKTINFALVYGLGIRNLAKKLGISIEKATRLREAYFRRYPKVDKLLRSVSSKGRSVGFVTNWFGRRLMLADPRLDYTMSNHLIQSSGADIIKNAMVEIYEQVPEVHIMASIHDELLFEVDDMGPIEKVKNIMENSYLPLNGMKMKVSIKRYDYGWGSVIKG